MGHADHPCAIALPGVEVKCLVVGPFEIDPSRLSWKFPRLWEIDDIVSLVEGVEGQKIANVARTKRQ
jgi:hypothetical protein